MKKIGKLNKAPILSRTETHFFCLQGEYIKHPVVYELSHKYGLPTDNINESQLSNKLEELKDIIRRWV